MRFLDTRNGSILFQEVRRQRFFVDKSLLIQKVYEYANDMCKYICVTRPRRFGKSTAANMLAAFFAKGSDSRLLFSGLKIAEASIWKEGQVCPIMNEMNAYHVFHMNMMTVIKERENVSGFIDSLKRECLDNLKEVFPFLAGFSDPDDLGKALLMALEKTGEQFIFIIDEWDMVFEDERASETDKKAYISFLQGLLKDQPYVKFAYMTGILPIANDSSGSPLNMFDTFSALDDDTMDLFFGFTLDEISEAAKRGGFTKPSLDEIKLWYDGYVRLSDGVHVCNPKSVNRAFASGSCRNYWTGTGPMNDVERLIMRDIQSLRTDVVQLLAEVPIDIVLEGFGTENMTLGSRNEILSAMVVYGFLSYDQTNHLLSIPNLELRQKFQRALSQKEMGLAQTLKNSSALLEATVQRKADVVAEMIEKVHDTEATFIYYSDENSLACVVALAYYAAREKYDISREEKSGKGFVDFLFKPRTMNLPGIIIELKYNHSAKNAIDQIRKRNYIQKLKDLGVSQILLVGISYSEHTGKHTCLVEDA